VASSLCEWEASPPFAWTPCHLRSTYIHSYIYIQCIIHTYRIDLRSHAMLLLVCACVKIPITYQSWWFIYERRPIHVAQEPYNSVSSEAYHPFNKWFNSIVESLPFGCYARTRRLSLTILLKRRLNGNWIPFFQLMRHRRLCRPSDASFV